MPLSQCSDMVTSPGGMDEEPQTRPNNGTVRLLLYPVNRTEPNVTMSACIPIAG